MNIVEVDTRSRRQVRAFLDLPFRLYRDTPQWVPPLDIDARLMLDRRRHPFYKHSEAAFFLALDHAGQAIGRVAALENRNYNAYNRACSAFFYLFECVNDLSVSQGLLEAACRWAAHRGLNHIFGPKGFTPFDGFGVLVKGFEHRPAFGLPYTLPYYPALLEAAGFTTLGDWVSGYLDGSAQLPERIHELAERLMQRRGLRVVRCETRADLRTKIIPYLHELYNLALVGTDGAIPLTEDDIRGLTDQMLWFAEPRLIKILVKSAEAPGQPDEPVGFLLAYPDVSAAVQRIRGRVLPFGWIQLLLERRRTDWVNVNGAGIIERYRGLGGTGLLFSEMAKSVKAGGYRHADLVQVSTENDRMQRELRGLGIEFYKVHRMYQKTIA
jgi:hypothetical protein